MGWDSELQKLLASGVITGYALITQDRTISCVYGSLEGDLWTSRNRHDLSPAAQQFYSAFHLARVPSQFQVCGQQVFVFHSTEGSLYAVSRGRKLGVLVGAIMMLTCV